MVITIDGPAGAGKSTVGRELAKSLGFTYLDTGAMYRAVALAALKSSVSIDDANGLDTLCPGLVIKFSGSRILLNGKDITEDIRTPLMDRLSSAVSAVPVVRTHLTRLQREMARGIDLVAEGRDMGTVVFPHAEFKFFLTASPEERARRRKGDIERKGIDMPFEEILAAIRARDAADSNRPVAPLRPAEDAVLVDSSELNISQVIELMTRHVKNRMRASTISP